MILFEMPAVIALFIIIAEIALATMLHKVLGTKWSGYRGPTSLLWILFTEMLNFITGVRQNYFSLRQMMEPSLPGALGELFQIELW